MATEKGQVLHLDEVGEVMGDLNRLYMNGELKGLVVVGRRQDGAFVHFEPVGLNPMEAVFLLELAKASVLRNVLGGGE